MKKGHIHHLISMEYMLQVSDPPKRRSVGVSLKHFSGKLAFSGMLQKITMLTSHRFGAIGNHS
jgi:hypothetical protein